MIITNQVEVITGFKRLMAHQGFYLNARRPLRDAIVNLKGRFSSAAGSANWIWFPYYHHVFEDERKGFARQVAYLKSQGDIISLDQAVAMINNTEKINGRYFCITFDDGLRSCYTNAVPILLDYDVTAAFFIIINYTGDDDHTRITSPLYDGMKFRFEYLTWEECRQMILKGMIIGSHTLSHKKLAELSAEQVQHDMTDSKRIIEQKVGAKCLYYACPWGTPGKSFDEHREPFIARMSGYKALLTTTRGRNVSGQDPFALQRDHLYANWSTMQLRYFMNK